MFRYSSKTLLLNSIRFKIKTEFCFFHIFKKIVAIRQCIKMKSPKQLLTAQQHALATVMTTIDGELLPSHPYLMLRDMPTAPVPLIVGKTRDEGTVFVYPNYADKLSEDMYRLYLTSYLPAMALDDMMKVYPCAADGDCRAALAAFAGDFALICPTVCFLLSFFFLFHL